MNTPASLRVRISADLADIRQGLGLLRGELASVKKQAAAAAPDSRKWGEGFRDLRRELVQLGAALVSLRAAKAFVALSDEATQLRGRVRAAGGEYKAVLALAQETRTGLTQTVDLYARLERSTRSMGLSQERLLGITRTVNQAVRLSFATAQAGDAAITQFGQALAGGQLRGEELNSVLEQTPRLAEAVAKGLGLNIAQMRALAKEGKITNAEVLKALGDQAGVIEEEFADVPVTIGDAFVQIRNSFLDFIGSFNEGSGAAQAFSRLLQDVARDMPQFFEPALGVVASLAEAFRSTSDAAQDAGKSVEEAGRKTRFMAGAGAFLANVLRVLAAGAVIVKNTVEIVTVTIGALADIAMEVSRVITGSLLRAFTVIGSSWQALATGGPPAVMRLWSEEAGRLAQDAAGLSRSIANSAKTAAGLVGDNMSDLVTGVRAAFAEIDRMGSAAPGSGTTTGNPADDPADPGKALARSNALLRDATERALKELERLYGEGRVSIKDYFAERERLQLRAIDLAIEQARAELAVADKLGPRRKLEEEIASLQRDRAEVGVRSAREQAKAEQDLAAQVADLKRQLGDVSDIAAVGEAERARVLREYEVLFRRLEAESGAAGEQMGQALVERLVARAQQDALGEAATKIGTALRSIETAVGAQVGAGTMGMGEGERQLAAARAKALADYQQLRAAAISALSAHEPGSPAHTAAVTGLRELDTEIANVIASQDTWRQKTEDLAANSLGDALADLITGAKGFKQAFSDMVRSFVAGVARMIAQEVALRAVRNLLGGFLGGPVQQNPTATTAIGTGVGHSGGIAGQLSVRRSINPLLFGEAPRYHGGGIAGLAPDEVPAILRRDEEIVTRSDRRHRANGGLGGGRADNYRIEVINTAQPVKAGETTVSQQPDGTQLIRLVLHAVADDLANGGVIAAAGRGRYGWKDQV